MTDALSLVDDWGPEKIVVVSHRRTGMKGVLVIDNTARGIGKGGTRMSPTVTVDEVARLARVMTWKWASADLFYGGAKAGIVAAPASPDKEAILRAFARALSNEVPREYVMGLDMGLTESDAAIIQDELGDRGAAVGTPEHLGGVAYDKLGVTGYGVAESTDAAAQRLGLPLGGARVAIQGFGAVGSAAARRFSELGATVVAVSTAHGALHDPTGLDVDDLLTAREEHGDHFVTRRPVRGTTLASGAELTVDCDILVPAALQDVIDHSTAHEIKARLVVEGANLPTSVDAQDILDRRGITVVPDFVANAGGVVAAAFAMDARYSGFRPDTTAIFETISTRLRANTVTVLDEAERCHVTPHAAGRALAEQRVRTAMRSKGRLPRD
ncbi:MULTISPECIES: Glu/Leu/Phe/Val dehydrogenase dimerization domain-containing protein [unclassified Streptomyces]|uniref:Glu/Leu/Phe/Val family dehydrogenase n=1 Tax=unclassified Streptomyces TaxID=2593676 RepID=UPI002366EF81|nr:MULTISPECIES: Glu/Leu/Phe/Val dehydrogenase dimerization domain-containing protein [unclassified Streptomyces]MDF3141897.1 Glu/Leu/Phe/Val dehydrogenase dimerization domain-containing protein [Streptomyces sp. T21Q-yed]WDF39920.1 Glu/Leu/Phe/Val dehydrogenase dimerization domain-containing protein [Streptomyces sp. T12]